jgi:hypothetical protein
MKKQCQAFVFLAEAVVAAAFDRTPALASEISSNFAVRRH